MTLPTYIRLILYHFELRGDICDFPGHPMGSGDILWTEWGLCLFYNLYTSLPSN